MATKKGLQIDKLVEKSRIKYNPNSFQLPPLDQDDSKRAVSNFGSNSLTVMMLDPKMRALR